MIILKLFFVLNMLSVPQSAERQGTLFMFVRDRVTGYGVEASVIVSKKGKEVAREKSDEGGHLVFHLAPGEYRFTIKSQGYEIQKTHFTVESGKELKIQVQLDPTPEKMGKEIPKITIEKGYATYRGYIVDLKTGKPVGNVKIYTKKSGIEVQSDQKGYFIMRLPVPNVTVAPEAPPPSDTLIFEKDGYKSLELRNLFLIEDSYLLRIDLVPGKGKLIKVKKHGLYTPQSEEEKEHNSEGGKENSFEGNYSPPSIFAVFLDPPQTIRVGTNCSCTNCYDVTVMSLEAYTETGLDDEWISSWDNHSLRAGAVAYRSYGAWYVVHPLSENYDICDNACCQVWQPDQAQRTRDAAIYTSGIMLEQYSSIARSEYSAENNNQGCGDCYSGTGDSWPCISDEVCCGQTPNGHGRGMCQWGSERWAYYQDKTWDWILDHYYNPGDMNISTPMEITSTWAVPDTVEPGETFTIYADVFSGAEDQHNQIMLGASLFLNGQYINDSEDDRKVTIQPGNSQVWRNFYVPENSPEGTFDLLVALWFDIDEDNQITGIDLPLYLVTVDSAVVVTEQFLCGDVNNDGQVNTSDLIYLADYLFFGGPPPDPLLSGDANGNCSIENGDLTYLANYLFSSGPPPNCCSAKQRITPKEGKNPNKRPYK